MTELELHQGSGTDLHAQMDYAKAVSTASMLPENYRNKPADIMLAVGLGQGMGLSPAESLYRISVIKGKPTASAELIAANVRKAGHRLRVKGDETSCTATIIRADDPDFPFEVTRDLAWAKQMGLADQPNYKKQPGTMLQWRAITAVARLACPEALYGVAFTPDEIGDAPEQRTVGGLAAALAEPVRHADEVPVAQGGETLAPRITDRTRKALFALMGEVGINQDDDQRDFLSDTLGRVVESRSTLTEAEGVLAGKRLRAIQQGDQDAEWIPTFDVETTTDEALPLGGDQ